MSILKFIAASGAAWALACAPAAHAAVETAKPKAEAKKKAAAKPSKAKSGAKSKAKPAPVAPAVPDPEADEPDVLGSAVVDYDCELGNKVTLYQNAGDESHVALRWKTRLHRLTRVATTTGAQRFENKHYGLIWIGIPAKGMLLDSKKNRQLANECRNAEQLNPADVPAQAPAVIEAAVDKPASPAPATSAGVVPTAPDAPKTHM
ncbi:MliC family protein [Pseudoduganella lutea]|uniref:MliC family protein n=1 Tax=Pseudoduganella lutea TaxID=321985 RepID=UPI001E385327|nr:MliC family protein [Pseudoduganella lutea]